MHERGDRGEVHRLVRILRRRWLAMALVFLATFGAVVASTLAQAKQYSATATLLFRDPGFDQTVFGSLNAAGATTDPDREGATNVGLVALPEVAKRTAVAIGPSITTADVTADVSVSPKGAS